VKTTTSLSCARWGHSLDVGDRRRARTARRDRRRAVLAVIVAIGYHRSPQSARSCRVPDGGIAFDGPVLGYGFLLLLVLLSVITLGLLLRRARRVVSHVRRISAPLGSRAGRLASDIGLPVTAVVGIRFALEPSGERDAAPVRSALVGRCSRDDRRHDPHLREQSEHTRVAPLALRMELELRNYDQRQRRATTGRATLEQ